MRVADFSFDLPDELIARFPATVRSASRLLTVDGVTGDIGHRSFSDILSLVNPGDLLVFNDTRVIPARLYGQKESGGKVEVLVERILDEQRALAHVRASKAPKEGAILLLEGELQVQMIARHDALFELQFDPKFTVLEWLERLGHMPLPPYMEREEQLSDKERYQTVYGRNPGAVAAPTAGLHFDDELLAQLRQKGVEFAFVTLHVGAGTFQPVRVDSITDHKMHSEWVEVKADVVELIRKTREQGGRVIAVGTTSVRSLESMAQASCPGSEPFSLDDLKPFCGETEIFIYPGYRFSLVDALITNFHLPQSTLLMLVSAFAGSENIKEAYRQAVEMRYRFFSYGDAMWLTQTKDARRAVK